uniref:Dol-P-Glc:Glc(2)Man(9)GlcNAc(2)-PP-Dol alpha-1,2-glucosyltransferase n=1 Tax=Romanomermis culicivorax TaxID=13658 RepID=A0A915L6V6_ROMCU
MKRPSQSVGIFLSCVAALFSGTVLIHILVGSIVPNVYMDEIFHVDQMQRYCAGNFTSWNAKITTPPGLYLTCLLLLKPVLWFLPSSSHIACGTPVVLRYFNALFLTILFCLYFALFRLLSAGRPCSSVILSVSALNLTLFPLCYFFSFLFYTDVLSLNSVLLCYLLQIRRHHHWSAVLEKFILAFSRQTNIIWVAFCAALTIVDLAALHAEYFALVVKNTHDDSPRLDAKIASFKKNRQNPHVRSDFNRFAREKYDSSRDASCENCVVDFYDKPLLLLRTLKEIYEKKFSLFVNFIITVLSRCFGYILVGFLAIIFVFYNGSIVLGDRSAHQGSLHLVQIFYCAGFIFCFGFPILSSFFKNVFNRLRKHGLFTRALFVSILVIIYHFTMDHPYLLADNRHFTFYIWRRWFQYHKFMKYLLAPAYLFALYAIIASLHVQSFIWRFFFVTCCILVTVPNRLLEFRYFLIPYVMWRLHQTSQSKQVLLMEFCVYAVVNTVILYLFLFKPFRWANESGLQRFMW